MSVKQKANESSGEDVSAVIDEQNTSEHRKVSKRKRKISSAQLEQEFPIEHK